MEATTEPHVEGVAGIRPRVLRIREVSKLVGLAVSTIYQWQREGRFPRASVRYPGCRTALYRVEEIERWLDEHVGRDSDAAA